MTPSRTGITADERFEIYAEVFYKETGLLAPGKDAGTLGSEDYDKRRKAAWSDFMDCYAHIVYMTVDAVNKVLV